MERGALGLRPGWRPHVVPGSGAPCQPASRSFDRIVATADLPPIVFHDLRRTAATLLKDRGVPARDAQVILGHSTVSVTLGIYSEVFDTEVASALRQINRALGGPGTDPQARSM